MRAIRLIATAAAGASAAMIALASPALAADEPKSAPASGSAVLAAGAPVAPLAVVNVGGGTWNYGTDYSLSGQKHCFSYYTHPTNRHTATAIIGADNRRVSASAGNWARADAYGGAFNTCYTYWKHL